MQRTKEQVYQIYLTNLAALTWQSFEAFVQLKMQADNALDLYLEEEITKEVTV